MMYRTNGLTEWQSIKLIEVCKVNPTYKLTDGDLCSFIDMAAVNEDSPHVKRIETKQYNKQSGSKFTEDDVLFARITPCTENGKTALVKGLHTKYGIGSTEFIVLSPLKEKLDSKYLYYLVKWPLIRNKAIGRMIGTTGRQRVPNEFFKDELILDLPSLIEQRKIVDILTSVENAISKTKAIIEQTEKVKKGLMQQLLTKGIGHTKFKQTENGAIPEGWEYKVVGDLIKFEGGAQPPRDTFVSEPKEGYIRLIQIRDYKTDKYATYIPRELARKFCDNTDVMIGRYGPPIFQVLRGIEGAYNVALIKAIPSERATKNYIYYFLKQEALFKLIDGLSQRTSGQTGIDMDALKGFPFPLPPLAEQNQITSILDTWQMKIEKEQEYLSQLNKIQKGLMQALLTGRVRVKVDDQEVVTI